MSQDSSNNRPGIVHPGTQLAGMYEIDSLLATGGMGEVYKGHEIQTGDLVAIKLIKAEMAENEAALALFRKEASALRQLHHEAIVRYFVFSFDKELQRHFLAMELVEGASLSDLVKRGPLPAQDVHALMVRVAQGLQKAHERGIVHRDVSPDNIIVPDNRIELARIIDFGIARSTRAGEGTVIGGGFAGKYNYVSPEQLGLFGGDVTGKSDIYSLGLVLAQAVRGSPLDMGGSQFEVVDKRRSVPGLADVDARMRPMLERMLAPDPANRPASMAEVAAWPLAAAGKGGRPKQAAAVAAAKAAKPVREKSDSVMGIVLPVAVVAVLAVGGFAAWLNFGPGDRPVPPPKPPHTDLGPAQPKPKPGPVAVAENDPKPPEAVAQPADAPAQPAAGPTINIETIISMLQPGKDKPPVDVAAAAVPADIQVAIAEPLLPVAPLAVKPPEPPVAKIDKPVAQPKPPETPVVVATLPPPPPTVKLPDAPVAPLAIKPPEPPVAKIDKPAALPEPQKLPEAKPVEKPPEPPVAKIDKPVAQPKPADNPAVVAALPPPPLKHDAVEAAARLIRDYDGGGCFLALPRVISAKAAEIEGFASDLAVFTKFDAALTAKGIDAQIDVRQIQSTQCAAIHFINQLKSDPADVPRLVIARDRVPNGQHLEGTILTALAHVKLLIVDEEGNVADATLLLKQSGEHYAFKIPLVLEHPPTNGPQPELLLAIASAQPVPALKALGDIKADKLFPGLLAEVKKLAGPSGVAARYFKVE